MKITNLQLINANNIFTSVADKRLPQKISFAVMKNMTGLQDDFKCYSDSLNKIFKAYSEYMIKDENDEPTFNESGIPMLNNASKTKEMNEEIVELLKIEIDISLHTIDEECFDYEEGDKYDVLTPAETLNLMNILCYKEDDDNDKLENKN